MNGPAPGTRGGGLRSRLLAGFILVGVPPLIVLAAVVTTRLSSRFEDRSFERLQQALTTVEQEIERLQIRSARQLAAVVGEDLPAAAAHGPALATEIALRRDLDALEIIDEDGRVVSSHHWPAGFGLPDVDAVFEATPSLRVERTAAGYGVAEQLAVMATQRTRLGRSPVVVRGGAFLDAAFLTRLATLMGHPVAIRDAPRRRWIAGASSPLEAWEAPVDLSAGTGLSLLGDESYQWAAKPLARSLWLVVATPRTELDTATRQIERVTLVVGGAALVACLAAALLLSGRIARPVRELADGARRVASGDLSRRVPVSGRDEVGELAQAFNSMTEELHVSRERLLQAERVAAWREMAQRLAHELRNPLFPIQLSIETLRRAAGKEVSADGASGRTEDFPRLFRDATETILDELRALRKIIDEFSEFAKMPRPRPQPSSLNTVVERVLDLYRAQATGVEIVCELEPELPLAPLDADLMARAVGNLVVNALEAMAGSGTLGLRTAALERAVSVSVADSGPGLDDEQRTRLFTPYYTTKKAGTGLGLAIVQGVISDHGGRVEVASEPGHGTTFTLILPTAPRGPSVRS